MKVARVAAVAGVLALAAVLGWRLAHQDNATAKAVLHGKGGDVFEMVSDNFL